MKRQRDAYKVEGILKDMRAHCSTMTRKQYADHSGHSYAFISFYCQRHDIQFLKFYRYLKPVVLSKNMSPLEILKMNAESLVNKTDHTYIIKVPTDGRRFYNIYKREVLISEAFREMFIKHINQATERYNGIDKEILTNLLEDIESDLVQNDAKIVMHVPTTTPSYSPKRGKSAKQTLRRVITEVHTPDKYSKGYLLKCALIEEDFSITRAAAKLGVSLRTVRNWINKLKQQHKFGTPVSEDDRLNQLEKICEDHIRFSH